MKTLFAGAVALALIAGPVLAQPPAAATAPAAAAAKLSSNSTLTALAKDPKAKEILVKHIPQIAEFLFSGQAEGVLPPETTLKALADIPQAVDAGLSPEAMKKIEEDLAKL
jgi:hypothetical protein